MSSAPSRAFQSDWSFDLRWARCARPTVRGGVTVRQRIVEAALAPTIGPAASFHDSDRSESFAFGESDIPTRDGVLEFGEVIEVSRLRLRNVEEGIPDAMRVGCVDPNLVPEVARVSGA